MKRKSQTSTEFLIITAVLLILLIIFFSVILDIPSLSTNKKEEFVQDYWKENDISITNAIRYDTNTTFSLKNNFRYQIEIYEITFDNVTQQYALTLNTGELVMTSIDFTSNYPEVIILYTNLEDNRNYTFTGKDLYIKPNVK